MMNVILKLLDNRAVVFSTQWLFSWKSVVLVGQPRLGLTEDLRNTVSRVLAVIIHDTDNFVNWTIYINLD